MKLFNIFGGKKKLEKELELLHSEIEKRDKTIGEMVKQKNSDDKAYNILEVKYTDLKTENGNLEFALDEKIDANEILKQENKIITQENKELKKKIADMESDTKYYKIKKVNAGGKPKAQAVRVGTRTKANQVQKELKEKADLREEK